MRTPFVNQNKPVEPEDWLTIDTILIKEYHLRPWELDELTLTECSWMLLALRSQEDNRVTLHAGQDPGTMRLMSDKMNAEVEKRIAYLRLPPEEKLKLAYKEFGRDT